MPNTPNKGNHNSFAVTIGLSLLFFFFFIFKKCFSMVQNHTVKLLMKSMKRVQIWTAYDLGCER